MNDQPLTRRDVVALFTYVFLGVNVLSALLACFNRLILSHVPLLFSRFARSGEMWIWLGTAIVQLLLLPLVSLVAASATGKSATQVVTRRTLRSLLLPCVGVSMLAQALPSLLRSGYLYYDAASSPFIPSLRLLYLGFIVGTLVQMSLGFALAFFPVIFATLRGRMRGENENAP